MPALNTHSDQVDADLKRATAAFGEAHRADPDTLTAWHAHHLAEHAAGHRKGAGVWYTPAPVVTAMFDLVDSGGQRAERVLDPCTGTGVFLAEAARRGATHLIGWDLEPAALLIAAQRVPGARLTVRDALAQPAPTPVDLIITNPPWARDKGGGGWLRAGWQGAPPLLDDLKAEGVHARAAQRIVAFRAGPDATLGTDDDAHVTDLAALDGIKYVGPVALRQLVAAAGTDAGTGAGR